MINKFRKKKRLLVYIDRLDDSFETIRSEHEITENYVGAEKYADSIMEDFAVMQVSIRTERDESVTSIVRVIPHWVFKVTYKDGITPRIYWVAYYRHKEVFKIDDMIDKDYDNPEQVKEYDERLHYPFDEELYLAARKELIGKEINEGRKVKEITRVELVYDWSI